MMTDKTTLCDQFADFHPFCLHSSYRDRQDLSVWLHWFFISIFGVLKIQKYFLIICFLHMIFLIVVIVLWIVLFQSLWTIKYKTWLFDINNTTVWDTSTTFKPCSKYTLTSSMIKFGIFVIMVLKGILKL